MEEIKQSYYAIIPANVRYDNDISPNAKLLYGEITALCNQKGYCWASNQYFSDLYGVSDRTIQSLIKQLRDKNYIRVELKENTKRLIYIEFTTHEKNFIPPTKFFSYPHEENFTHNNTKNNKEEYIEIKECLDCSWIE
jgi:SOS-response transcriptional repressor LexA